ncbi:CPBP family intramembrane glutamic endopeptidase [Candidatus Methylobacter oryzae]|uniref:CPBP family intramembrane metalloprotease n=1 Tax=Candidatus Methylobacter oryzae TaxID=2497749 RepID=A0ABY3CNE7_9GAMM|nr:type II CAAX endopeptidase family protein [Candidatus Methylobacter oryzae]TRX03630.1 CPBP family intramembrane metalloprotease [Candidatus Methylobacter oryzae]
MKRYIAYSIVPLLVLLAATSTACVLSYLIVLVQDDPSSLRTLITRLTQILLLLSIFPAMAYLNFKKEDLGFSVRPIFLKQLPQGFGLGLITLMPIFMILYALGVNVVDDSQPWDSGLIAKKTILSLLLALLIAVVEESVFRGMLLAGLKKNMPVVAAILISSAYFAALHFLDTRTEISPQDFNIFSGFILLGEAFANIVNPKNASAFVGLLVVGIFLAVLRTQVKESLGLCIGCHAGWVWQIKMNNSIFNTNMNSEYLYLVSINNNTVGPLVTGWLGFAIAGYFVYKKLRN